MMNLEQARFNINPVLSGIFLGVGQGTKTAEALFPKIPMALRGGTVPRIGTESLRRYDLARAPGADTRRVDLHWDGVVVTVKQKAVDIPIPREFIDKASNEARSMNISANIDISTVAMTTAMEILNNDYEADAAVIAANPASYAVGNVLALAGATKWSAATGTPLSDLDNASNAIRQKVGRSPNVLHLSAVAFQALKRNPQILNAMSTTAVKVLTPQLLATMLGFESVCVGDAVVEGAGGVMADLWGNNAILAFAPVIGGNAAVGQPAFGMTNILMGHPFAEQPWYDHEAKTWVYGATYERSPQIVDNRAGFLIQNPF